MTTPTRQQYYAQAQNLAQSANAHDPVYLLATALSFADRISALEKQVKAQAVAPPAPTPPVAPAAPAPVAASVEVKTLMAGPSNPQTVAQITSLDEGIDSAAVTANTGANQSAELKAEIAASQACIKGPAPSPNLPL